MIEQIPLPKPDDGGPAFPAHDGGIDQTTGLIVEARTQGMSLRDWFAGQANEGDIKHWMEIGRLNGIDWTREQARYQHADAMLKARSR